jgi:hypothetical protein
VVLGYDPKARPLVPVELAVGCPPARFLQYRLTLSGEAAQTPVVDRVSIAYAVPNLKPVILAIGAQYVGEPAGPSGTAKPPQAPAAGGAKDGDQEPRHEPRLNITWKAEDPNGDSLLYELEYRHAGVDLWLPLVDELTTSSHVWQTLRVPDGWYVVRVVASDAPDNPADMARTTSRRSDPVLVDNTPPVTTRLAVRREGRTATVELALADELSAVHSVHWAVDAAEDWQPALPADGIFDSTSEQVAFTIPDLEPGPHVVTVRIADARGNAAYQATPIPLP